MSLLLFLALRLLALGDAAEPSIVIQVPADFFYVEPEPTAWVEVIAPENAGSPDGFGSVSCRVQLVSGGVGEARPIPGVLLALGNTSELSDASGEFRFERVAAGTHLLTAYSVSLHMAQTELSVSAGRETRVIFHYEEPAKVLGTYE